MDFFEEGKIYTWEGGCGKFLGMFNPVTAVFTNGMIKELVPIAHIKSQPEFEIGKKYVINTEDVVTYIGPDTDGYHMVTTGLGITTLYRTEDFIRCL